MTEETSVSDKTHHSLNIPWHFNIISLNTCIFVNILAAATFIIITAHLNNL